MAIQDAFDCPHPVALVTGSGAPRVGRVIAQRLSDLGCSLAIHARHSLDEATKFTESIRERGGQAITVKAALEVESEITRMFDTVMKQFGRIDILINTAAIWAPKPLEQVRAEDVAHYFDVNAIGSFLCARAAGLQMTQQSSGGCIVNFGDWATCRPYCDHAAYFPSKGAVEAMTRSLAVELATRNPRVRVNCVSPGPVLLADSVSVEERQRIADSVLLRRVGTADEVAHAVVFLCENQFVTGVTLPVDGGKSIFANDGMQCGMNTG